MVAMAHVSKWTPVWKAIKMVVTVYVLKKELVPEIIMMAAMEFV